MWVADDRPPLTAKDLPTAPGLFGDPEVKHWDE
jgi:hypothetical protein